jgi:hypothetical protein
MITNELQNKVVIETFLNSETQMMSYVSKHVKGFSVTLKDVDADQFVGFAIIYPTLEAAILKAKEV